MPRDRLSTETQEHHMNEFRDAIVKIRTIQVDVAYMDSLNGTEVVVDGSLLF